MFKLFEPKKKTNNQLLYWSIYVGTVVVLIAKILELSSDLSMKIIAEHPELAEYSTMVKVYLIFS
ncbi:MAG: hypothetical protein WC850_01335 [Candidatus Gracilibacteria bacterium]